MGNFVTGAGLGPASIISRAAGKLDAFAVGMDGRVYTAAWEPGDTAWRGWWVIDGLEVAPCAPIAAVSRGPGKMDIFAVGLDGRIYNAAWEPAAHQPLGPQRPVLLLGGHRPLFRRHPPRRLRLVQLRGRGRHGAALDVGASVHVLELDNDAGGDDCYLHSFQVPEPGRL